MLVGRSTGGIGTHAVDLARELTDLGDQVAFVTDELTAARFAIPGARLWWPSRTGGLSRTHRHLWLLHQLVREADVVHAHGHQAGLLAVVAALTTSTPVVVSQHNAVLASGRLGGQVSTMVQRVVARRAALVTGASSDLVDEARRHGASHPRLAPVPSPRVPGLLARHTATAPERSALAHRLMQQAGIAPGGPLVLTISRIAAQKRLQVLVEAASRLASAATWVVVGDGDADRLDAHRLDAETRGAPVHFVGAVADPSEWLRAAEVFVLPSSWEARALVVQEAMAAGTPVVASDAGGLPELVEGAGLLVPVGDAAAVARAVEDVLTDPELRGRLSQQGRDRATSWGDGKAAARRWHQWYSTLLRMT
jgi:glycosyltransferase involved in cell wall biosynthesis